MHRYGIISLLLVCLLLPAVGRVSAAPRAAPLALTADEIMAAVNALRRSHDLEPYVVDPVITAYAQEHSEYQARMDLSDHLHSDGQVSLAHGYVENVAGGDNGYLTAEAVVYEVWNDPVHMKHMIGYESGAAGVGVASNATTTFVTLNVRPGDGQGPAPRPGVTPGVVQALPPIALVPLLTATAGPGGAVIHEVGYGQTLWAIALAYGVSGERLRALNGMAPDDSAIWAGQKLLIVPAGQVTPPPPAAATSLADPAAVTAPPDTAAPTPAAALLVTSAAPAAAAPAVAPTASAPAVRRPIDPIFAGLLALAAVGLLLFLSAQVKLQRRE